VEYHDILQSGHFVISQNDSELLGQRADRRIIQWSLSKLQEYRLDLTASILCTKLCLCDNVNGPSGSLKFL
jgi:hypothetical protein